MYKIVFQDFIGFTEIHAIQKDKLKIIGKVEANRK